jgi:hypothetical protein
MRTKKGEVNVLKIPKLKMTLKIKIIGSKLANIPGGTSSQKICSSNLER